MSAVAREIDCDLARRLFSRSLDGDLSGDEEFALVDHLLRCRPCDRFTAYLEVTVGLLRSTQPEPFRAASSVTSVTLPASGVRTTRRSDSPTLAS